MGLSVKDLGWCIMFQERDVCTKFVKEFFKFVKLIYMICLLNLNLKIYTCRIHSMYMRTKEFFLCKKDIFVIFSTRFFFSFFNFLCKYTRHILYKHEYNISHFLYQGHHQISI